MSSTEDDEERAMEQELEAISAIYGSLISRDGNSRRICVHFERDICLTIDLPRGYPTTSVPPSIDLQYCD